jgi:pilus assembly protein Flp/PilA
MSFLLLHATSDSHLEATDMMNLLKRFLKNESGAAAIEYGLIASGISVVIIPSVNNVGTKLVQTFTTIQNAL